MAVQPEDPHALYRFFGAGGTLLYIGITNSIPTRIRRHNADKPWWTGVANVTVEHYPNRAAVLEAERRAIKAEKPLYNEQHNQAGRWGTDTESSAPSSTLTPICMDCGQPVEAGDGFLHIDMADVNAAKNARAEDGERGPTDLWEFLDGPDRVARWAVHCGPCNPHVTWSHDDGQQVCAGCYAIDLDACRTWARLAWWTSHLAGKGWFAVTNWHSMLGAIARGDDDALFRAEGAR